MAKKVIVAVTDAKKGAARTTADKEGYKSFIIPDNVADVSLYWTPVGLLPIAVAGFDIDKLVAGAVEMEKACGADVPFEQNPAALYAATRNELYKNGKKIEILVNFNPKLLMSTNGGSNYTVSQKVRRQRYLPCCRRFLDRPSLHGTMDPRRRTYHLRNRYIS